MLLQSCRILLLTLDRSQAGATFRSSSLHFRLRSNAEFVSQLQCPPQGALTVPQSVTEADCRYMQCNSPNTQAIQEDSHAQSSHHTNASGHLLDTAKHKKLTDTGHSHTPIHRD